MTTGKPWTQSELIEICKVYAVMLQLEQTGKKYNKAAIRRATLPLLEGRSAGSYEMKCCNISAALNDTGAPWIKGYKPLAGYQRSLKAYAVTACNEMYDAAALFIYQQLIDSDKGARK